MSSFYSDSPVLKDCIQFWTHYFNWALVFKEEMQILFLQVQFLAHGYNSALETIIITITVIIYLNFKVKVIFIQWQNDQFWKFISTLILFSLSCNKLKIFLQSLTTVNIRHTLCSISLSVFFFFPTMISLVQLPKHHISSLYASWLFSPRYSKPEIPVLVAYIIYFVLKQRMISTPDHAHWKKAGIVACPFLDEIPHKGVLKCTKAQFHVDGKIFKNSVKTSLSPRNILSHKFQLHSLKG